MAAALTELTAAYCDRPGCWGCLRRDFPEHRKPLSAGEPLQAGTEKPQNVSKSWCYDADGFILLGSLHAWKISSSHQQWPRQKIQVARRGLNLHPRSHARAVWIHPSLWFGIQIHLKHLSHAKDWTSMLRQAMIDDLSVILIGQAGSIHH